jgi:hypothetical protein
MTDQERLDNLEAQAEAAYAKMYDAMTATEAAARYSDAKEALHDAIGLARRLGKADAAHRLDARLAHIKAVFRSQFAGLG